jgi:hypothetical protein
LPRGSAARLGLLPQSAGARKSRARIRVRESGVARFRPAGLRSGGARRRFRG